MKTWSGSRVYWDLKRIETRVSGTYISTSKTMSACVQFDMHTVDGSDGNRFISFVFSVIR
jgi:hypothetical protein